MRSPFLLRHLGLLLFAAGLLVLAIVGVRSTGAGPATTLRVLLRATSFAGAGLAVLAFFAALALVAAFELSGAWRRLRAWTSLKPGMSAKEVGALLAAEVEPRPTALQDREAVWTCNLHALGLPEEGWLAFSRDPEPRLLQRQPDDAGAARILAEWCPRGYGLSRMRDLLRSTASGASLLGMLAIALVSVVPVGARDGLSWTLHLPAAALVFGLAYEATASPGWRFDRFLTIPLQLIIAGAWGLRLFLLLKG